MGGGELWGSVSFQLAEQTLPDPSQLHGGAAKERLSESSAQRGSGDTVKGELGAQKMGSREGVRYVQRWETFMCRPSLMKRLWSLMAELGHGNANPRLPLSFLRQQGETRPLASPTLAQLAPGPHTRLAVPLPRFPSSRALSSSVLSPSVGKAASSIVSQGGKRTPSSQYLSTKFPDRLLSLGHESRACFGTGSRGLRVIGCVDWSGLGCVPALGLGGWGGAQCQPLPNDRVPGGTGVPQRKSGRSLPEEGAWPRATDNRSFRLKPTEPRAFLAQKQRAPSPPLHAV